MLYCETIRKYKIKRNNGSVEGVFFVDNCIEFLQEGLKRLLHVRLQVLLLKCKAQVVLQLDEFGPDQKQFLPLGHPYSCHHILHHQNVQASFQFYDLLLQVDGFAGFFPDAQLEFLPVFLLEHPVVLHFSLDDLLGRCGLVVLVGID